MLNHRRALLLTASTAVLAIGAGIASYQLRGASSLSEMIPADGLRQLQSVSFLDSDGKTQAVAQWRGKILVVNFWATWCPPCRQEMPGFSRLQAKHAVNGVQFIGIGIDSPSAIKEYAWQNPMRYPLLLGGSDSMQLVRKLGNPTAALPYTLVLNSLGEPVFSRLGMVDEETLEKLLLPLLKTASQGN